jgi:hypothetical protein
MGTKRRRSRSEWAVSAWRGWMSVKPHSNDGDNGACVVSAEARALLGLLTMAAAYPMVRCDICGSDLDSERGSERCKGACRL